MQIATVGNKHISKKNVTYLSLALLAILTVVGIGMTFFIFQNTTRANEEAPQNVSVAPTGTNAKVSWQTPAESVAVIEYGTQADASTFSEFAFSENPTTNHEVDLASLQPNTTYYFQIRIGEEVYDNGGSFWSFTTNDSAATSPTLAASATAMPTASTSATLQPTPMQIASISATLAPTPLTASISATQGPTPTSIKMCNYTDCPSIQQNLGTGCTTQDYLKCITGSTESTSATPTAPETTSTTTTSTSTGSAVLSASTKISCGIDYFQTSSCKSFSWTDINMKNPTCGTTFTKYFVQCKSSSFTSSDEGTWYCNETTTKNTLTVPCGTAPTPAPGQSVFCRVRAETEAGGANNSTAWMYANTSCASLSSSNSACAITYLQGNNCKSWLWDRVNNTNPACKSAFDHYTLQCTSNGDYTGASGTWYCDNASTNHYLDLPCFNAPTPADGATVMCRVRAEDAYGTDSHATSWVSSSAVCPTSTPTPTFTPTPTYTPTPTPTNTPTPTPTP